MIIGFTCNWCSYRAADLAGHGPHEVPAERPARPPDVLRSGRSRPSSCGPSPTARTASWSPAAGRPTATTAIQNVKALRRFLLLRRVVGSAGHRAGAAPAALRQRRGGSTPGHGVRPDRRRGPCPRPAGLGSRAGSSRRAGRRAVRRRGGDGMSARPAAPLRDVRGRLVRRLRHRRPQPGRGDPGRRRALRDRLLADGDGRQVRRRRRAAGRLDRRHPLLGRHPDQRERGARSPPPADVATARGLRLVRVRGLHPRALPT